MKELDPTTIESSEMVEQTFKFWYSDREHIRSPFPLYIREELKQRATQRFYEWASALNEKASEEVNDEIMGEKFEEIIFETALELVQLEDEKITINYPFLPRLGDEIKAREEKEEGSEIIDRWIVKEKDHIFLKVKMQKTQSGEKWETKFELPA